MIRRCYHVGRALGFPRAVAGGYREPPVLQPAFVNPDRESRYPLKKLNSSPDEPKPSDVYVPSSKQIFSNISKPPRNLVQVVSSTLESKEVPDNIPGKNVVAKNLISREDVSNSLQTSQNQSSLPAPLFMEQRLENYRSNVPQRISKMKFEQETAEREFEEAQSLFELQTAVKLNLPIMDHVNFVDALTAFHRLISVVDDEDQLHRRIARTDDFIDRTILTRDEMFNLPEFVVIIKGLVKYCRDFTADEGLEVITKLMDLKLPVDSVPTLVFLELMKTHINNLTINQLVRLFKCLSRTAEAIMMKNEEEGRKEMEKKENSSSTTKLLATMMGTEKLILLRFDEEQSWLSAAEIVDLITYVRESELTKELYGQAMTLLLTNPTDITVDSIVQYCRWMRTQSELSVIRELEFEALHETLFEIFIEILLQDSGKNDEFFSKRGRQLSLRGIMSAMMEVCNVQTCLRIKDDLDIHDVELPPFRHASFEITQLLGCCSVESRQLML